MITERLMASGQWSLKLRKDTPRSTLDRLNVVRSGFGHIVITPATLSPESVSDANMLASARYTGVFRRQPGEFELAGAGVNMWVADEDKKGTFVTGQLTTAGGLFAQWAAALKPAHLTAGIVSTIAGTFITTYERTNLRDPLNDVCNRFGAEWRVTNDFKFDIGLPADLFRATPTAIIVRTPGDGDRELGSVTGITGKLETRQDVEDWSRRIRYYSGANPDLTTADGSIADIDVIFRNPDGSALTMDRAIVASGDVPAGSATGLAAAQFAVFGTPQRELSLSTNLYDIGQDVRVGDNVYVYDPLRGILDTANQFPYHGGTVFPEKIRCVGLTWPVRQGMGVYFRRYVKTGGVWVVEWIDLTPYVVFEKGETTVDVGSRPRASLGGLGGSSSSPAGTGDVPIEQKVYAMAAGSGTTVGTINNGAAQNVNITFPSGRFTQPPMLVGNAENARLTLGFSSITTSGAVVSLANWSPAPCGVSLFEWHAVQMTQASGAG